MGTVKVVEQRDVHLCIEGEVLIEVACKEVCVFFKPVEVGVDLLSESTSKFY